MAPFEGKNNYHPVTPGAKATTEGIAESNEMVECANLNVDEVSFEPSSLSEVKTDDESPSCYIQTKIVHHFKRLSNWLFLFIVLTIVVWVLDYMTDEVPLLEDVEAKFKNEFQSEYFTGKNGSKAFTYMGLFYMLLGALCYLAFSVGIRLPTPHIRLASKYWRIPILDEYYSPIEFTCLMIFLLVQIIPVWHNVHEMISTNNNATPNPARSWFRICIYFAKPCTWTMMMLFFPVSKNNFWLELVNIKFERALKFHKILAVVLVVVTLVHGGAGLISAGLAGQLGACLWPGEESCNPFSGTHHGRLLKGGGSNYLAMVYMYGWMGTAVTVPMMITSLQWFRRHKYEWFYYSHFLFIPFVVFMHLHFGALYYMAPGLTAYVLDKVVQYCTTRRPVQLVNLYCPVPGYVRLVLAADPSLDFEPGMYVFVKVPAVSRFQYHPMSVASARPTKENPTITLDIKVLGDWTSDLEQLALKRDITTEDDILVYVDGFHGSSHVHTHGYLDHEAMLMVSGGIGVTPLMSCLRTVVDPQADMNPFPKLKKIVFVWVVKEVRLLDLYRDELSNIQQNSVTKFGVQVDVYLYVTMSGGSSDDNKQPTTTTLPPPLQQQQQRHLPLLPHTQGHGHNFLLVVLAGSGYLLGIVLANMWMDRYDFPQKYHALLQLGLALLMATLGSLVGMSRSLLCRRGVLPKYEALGGDEEDTEDVVETPVSVFEDVKLSISSSTKAPLSAVIGCRPNVEALVMEMRDACLAHSSIRSVGVGVCGPDPLVRSVMDSCKQYSFAKLPFVVDLETFDW